ncbi:AAA domain-containing protein [Bosea sp. CRIB-10]|uniref:AAA family ATPase n=1 Tax=Bosea sp. CRIB-10 TaxID=378404 RepID=UPI0008E2379B|nr:ATP-binding protein [Bosea sp. CRIB-10]SFD72535.1 AAA domain-containing protein [Bosea sp. CRIB-10]
MQEKEKQRFAPLKNVTALWTLVNRLQQRNDDLPGFGVFHGPPGFGKTKAAIYVHNKCQAPILTIGESWTRKKFLQKLLEELHESKTKGTVADLTEKAILRLGENIDRPLLIDEADKAIDKGWIELIRELQDNSNTPIILIGEEELVSKLKPTPRVHDRVLDWVPAQPCDLDDTRKLATAYAPQLQIADDLLELVRIESGGVARRISTTVSHIQEFAQTAGLTSLNRSNYGGRMHTGRAPAVRYEDDIRKLVLAARAA